MRASGPIKEQLELEVIELTNLLRHDDAFADLRDALATKGLNASETILAGLIEGEDETMYGVVLTPGQVCVLFETDPSGSLIRWEVIQDTGTLADDFDAVAVGIAMQRSGQVT